MKKAKPVPALAVAPVENVVVDAAVKAAMGAVTKEAAKSSNDLNVAAVADAKPELVAAMAKAVAADPVIQNATNSEANFWTKRTFWGALASACVFLTAVIGYLMENGFTADGEWRGTLTTVGFAIWAGYSTARAGIATTPLGTPPPQNRYPLNK